jgi:hypothetical protein
MATNPTKFRITLWFKVGALEADAEQPEGAAMLPIEDRYLDDGTVTSDDSRRFGLRSGRTQALARGVFEPARSDVDGQTIGHLVREMKGRRRTVIATLGGVAALGALLLFVF